MSFDPPSAAAFLGISVEEMTALVDSGAIEAQNPGFGSTVRVSALKACQERG